MVKNLRTFDFTRPLTYKGSHYPSTQMDIEDDKGNVASRNVFADANGQYYSLNNDGNAVPIILNNNLDEVTVTASKRKDNTPAEFGQYLKNYYTSPSINSSDNTRVLNTSHREYNPHLKDAALRGAESNALWEKEHPNATAWRDVALIAPFAVAVAPALAGAGDAWAGTTLGQGVANGLGILANTAKNSTFLPWLDAAATSYFGAQGLQDIANGKFTPETALEVMPLGRAVPPIVNESRHLATNINDYNNINNFIERYGYTEYKPKLGLIFDDEKLDRLTNQLVKQHNRFVRGVSVAEARKYYGFPEEWTDEQIAEYTLTHPHIPSEINSGGNIERNPVLYTSNSIDLAKQYTDGNGYIGILQRPIIYDSNRSKMLELNDFRFNRLPKEVNNDFNPSITTDEP